jgi:CheY-like chemotaxis protein
MVILLVDDEPVVRLTLAEELRHTGLEVHEAKDGDEAANLIRTPRRPFSLLVTDIHMPGKLDGRQVAVLMRARSPDAPVVYITGRPEVLEAIGPLGPNEVLLRKPFAPLELVGVVRQLLAIP